MVSFKTTLGEGCLFKVAIVISLVVRHLRTIQGRQIGLNEVAIVARAIVTHLVSIFHGEVTMEGDLAPSPLI